MRTPTFFSRSRLPLVMLATLFIAGCGGGEDTEQLPNTGVTATNSNYDGRAPATDDVQNFKLSVWDELVSTDRCGACHSLGGPSQSPQFVHDGNINIAYSEANTVVNLDDPGQSQMVTKVAGGHNCWLSSDAACAATLTRYITNWAGDSSGSVKTIELTAPVIRQVGESKSFPEFGASDFASSDIYTIATTFCSDCHVEGIQQPYLASANPEVAYTAVQSRINLQDPDVSRLVVRLFPEQHNCWDAATGDDDDCVASATRMADAITTFANGLTSEPIGDDVVASKALNLTGDGLLANSGGRFEDNVIALYEFQTGNGDTAFDTSGVSPDLHLSLSGNVDWVGGWGIQIGSAYIKTDDQNRQTSIADGKALGTDGSEKIHDLITASGEFSIEAWVVPSNITEEDASIITYANSSTDRNVTLGQDAENYVVLQRTTEADQNTPFTTSDNPLKATQQHLVVNYTASGGRRIYVNGEFTGDIDPVPAGLLNEWDDGYALVMGGDPGGQGLWKGTLRMVAIHNRALTPDQIQSNFEVGVGQKYFLLFSVSELIDIDESFVVFEVSEFDSYSYLFSNPFFISLDETEVPQGIPLEGMRIGINGSVPSVGQAFAKLNTTLNATDYSAGTGQPLSRLGALIGLENGPDMDEFFLSFERLGNNENVIIEPSPPPAQIPLSGELASDIGLKTFDEINASMSKVTGVPTTNAAVTITFNTVRQSLPSVANIQGFLSSQQMGITQMAIQYCDALVKDTGLRTDFFGSFNFSATADTAFATQAGRDQMLDPLITRMVGQNLVSQPDNTELRGELNDLVDLLTGPDCSNCGTSERTETVAKASCAAVLGSAVTLVQ